MTKSNSLWESSEQEFLDVRIVSGDRQRQHGLSPTPRRHLHVSERNFCTFSSSSSTYYKLFLKMCFYLYEFQFVVYSGTFEQRTL